MPSTRLTLPSGSVILLGLLGLFMRFSTCTATSSNAEPFPGSSWRTSDPESPFSKMVDGSFYNSPFSVFGVVNSSLVVEQDQQVDPIRNFNAWVNSFLFGSSFASWIFGMMGRDAGHYMLCYIRNFISGCLIYYCTAGAFHYVNYVVDKPGHFKDGKRKVPTSDVIWDQIRLAQSSLLLYSSLPVFSDWLIEEGFTRTYYDVSEIGGFVPYLAATAAYFCLVEIGIYWMHRTLHTNKFLYKHVHALHHKYNRPDTLSPWASIAFNPIDGILQASPYVMMLFVMPCHYLTHLLMVFGTAIWATFIHDTLDADIEPIMGNKYHTVHHTHYHYNFGQVFIFCDWYWGTLRKPDCKTGVGRKKIE